MKKSISTQMNADSDGWGTDEKLFVAAIAIDQP
ncbi:MAG: hypothetical protein A4E57_00632 [Syntrophorhabdaceae bacterium PtaU1.Bin034]|nr:MAG: hypothetical protein A4E57_00632 [Syntrophorhabdaceae bacterium PtaU1.Bin034]